MHEIAQRYNPLARVVYVDIDPVAVAHGKALLADNPSATSPGGDVRHAKQILADPEVRRLIDLDRPVGCCSWRCCISSPTSTNRRTSSLDSATRLPDGSYLVLSHFSNEDDLEQVEGLQRLSKGTPTRLTLRSRAEIAALLDGFELVEPGLVYLPQWRPDPDDVEEYPEWFNDFWAVGRNA